ncbi:MAG: hypothetical protein ACJAUL_003644 [Paraglaciecola sp.]|jgi:hypothetical protein
MSFNEEELKKVQSMTSGALKGKARSAIADTIREYDPKIQHAKSLAPEYGQKALLVLTNHASKQRHLALQGSVSSFNNSAWTAAATVENWLHELMGGDEQGIQSVEAIIEQLRARA